MRFFVLLSILLFAGQAAAHDENITLELSPAEAVALVSAMDRWPISRRTPPGFFDVQMKLGRALDQNPDGRRAVRQLERAR